MRHGHRERTLTGTFGKTRIAVPRARLTGEDGKTREWRSGSAARLPAPHAGRRRFDRRGLSRRDQHPPRATRALNAVFAAPVGKDVVSRVWRKVKSDWDAWNARPLADEPIVRLILDGTVARVRLDRKATSISLFVALGVRADGQKMLLAIKSMGGEGEAASSARCSDDFRQARIANAGAGRGRRRAGPRKGAGGAVARHGCPTLHRAQAPQPSRPCPRALASRKSRMTTAT